jgi:hypothetical protein
MTSPRADLRGTISAVEDFCAARARRIFRIFRHQRKFQGAGINRRVGRSHHQKPLKIETAARARPGATIMENEKR